jgi:ABC-type phosphate transport system substrate-binding protein
MAAGMQVIVNADNPITTMTPTAVQDVFFGKTSRWTDGTNVVAVDQLEKSPVRIEFSQKVMRKPVEAVKSFWLTKIFSGRGTPPVELKTDAAVMEAVRTQRGAIGYVSADTPLVAGVKAITVK